MVAEEAEETGAVSFDITVFMRKVSDSKVERFFVVQKILTFRGTITRFLIKCFS